jgi:hypothetical protein
MTVKRPPLDDPLDGLTHIQPTTAQRRVQGQNAVSREPTQQVWGTMSFQIVHDQKQAQWWWVCPQGSLHR